MLDMFECLKTGPKDLAMQPNTVGVLVGWAVGRAVGRSVGVRVCVDLS